MNCVRESEVWDALGTILDPELECDIVALGLIYRVAIEEGHVAVSMTLTTPGCPMNEILPAAVRFRLEELPGVEEATVEVVWDPPWEFSRMSPAAREKLGVPKGA